MTKTIRVEAYSWVKRLMKDSSTLSGLASKMTWVIAAGGRMGLNAASSVPDGGWSLNLID